MRCFRQRRNRALEFTVLTPGRQNGETRDDGINEGFGRGDRNLRPGHDVNGVVCRLSERRGQGVDEAYGGRSAIPSALCHGDDVGTCPRLRDRKGCGVVQLHRLFVDRGERGAEGGHGQPSCSSIAYFKKKAAWSEEPRATVTTTEGFLSRRAWAQCAIVEADLSRRRAAAAGISSISSRIFVVMSFAFNFGLSVLYFRESVSSAASLASRCRARRPDRRRRCDRGRWTFP